MEVIDSRMIEFAFGIGTTGPTTREHAASSRRLFVRSQDHLSIRNDGATGRVLTALQAFDAYGLDKIIEAVEYPTAVLHSDPAEPAMTLKRRRQSLGLSVDDLSRATKESSSIIEKCEDGISTAPIRILEKICISLGLDERLISFLPGAGGDESLAVRLKTLGSERAHFTSRVVSTLAEAAWVAMTQARLERELSIKDRFFISFTPDSNYGDSQYPAWQHGYYLAQKTRKLIGIDANEPIPSMRDLCSRLGFPVIQAELPKNFAGATIASGGQRAIVANTQGFNANVWVRRATLAHELGHLMWDPDERLNLLQVDEYSQLEKSPTKMTKDFVEARANAFAIEFLAPGTAVEITFNNEATDSAGLRAVMEKFGISATAARYHISNSIQRTISSDKCGAENVIPSPEWEGRESFTNDYFPMKSTSTMRRGEFCAAVVAAEMRGLISVDTAVSYLSASSTTEYNGNREMILSLFPQYSGDPLLKSSGMV